MIHHLPLTQIAPFALPRDRAALDPQALAELQSSIATQGLRQPIEVWRLSTPTEDGHLYGLISGLRRFTAHENLARLRGNGDFTTIQAFLRTPASVPEALAAMVTENEIRAQITPWEKAALILTTIAEGHYPTPDAAIAGLFPQSDATARSRLRAVVSVVQALDGHLTDPLAYSLRQLLRLSTAVKAGFVPVLITALQEHTEKAQPAQWELMQNILAEADRSLADPNFDPPPPHKARRLLHPRPGLTIRREWLPNGWRLVFTGDEAKGMMIESVMAQIERMYGQ
jgi:ParB family chromosome partitioning protein